jgi:hypothetical protein
LVFAGLPCRGIESPENPAPIRHAAVVVSMTFLKRDRDVPRRRVTQP